MRHSSNALEFRDLKPHISLLRGSSLGQRTVQGLLGLKNAWSQSGFNSSDTFGRSIEGSTLAALTKRKPHTLLHSRARL